VLLQDFNVQLMQRRLSRMRGERHDNEERLAQQEKIQQLTAELDEKTAVHNVLNEQIKRVNVYMFSSRFLPLQLNSDSENVQFKR